MGKSLLFEWFKVGRLPQEVRRELGGESIVMLDEGVSGSLTVKDFSGPRRRSSWRRRGLVGCLLVTNQRLMATGLGNRLLDVELEDPRLAKVVSSVPEKEILQLAFRAETFFEGYRGEMILRYRTPLAGAFYELVSGISRLNDGTREPPPL